MREVAFELGKVAPETFEEVIYPRLGARSDKVLAGPCHGVDCGIVDLGGGQVMALTTDPFFIAPELGWERAAWFAFHILASDITTTGLPPTYLTVDLNLPVSMTVRDLERMWDAVHRECVRYGVNVITGHTAKYEGCSFPMVGGATMVAVGPKDRCVRPGMVKPGDRVLLTKGAAIEATGLLAAAAPELIRERLGEGVLRRAQELFWKMSTVEDALAAAGAGVGERGVTCMHDATECGVWGGLFEIARAAGAGMRIRKDDIPVLEESARVCGLFGIDPYGSISEGTLLLTCREHAASAVLEALRGKGIPAREIGEVVEESRGIVLREKGRERPLEHPRVDPFWAAYARAAEESKRQRS